VRELGQQAAVWALDLVRRRERCEDDALSAMLASELHPQR
jgi:hypothetical protein